MQKQNKKKAVRPKQKQDEQPGLESLMKPKPDFYDGNYKPSGKLEGKFALITGGDSGIGRAVAVHYASEGADVAIIYLNENDDALYTAEFIKTNFNKECLLITCDIKDENKCNRAVEKVLKEFGQINILVNNAAIHFPQKKLEDITSLQLDITFRTNVYSMFYLTKAVLPQMKAGDTIINTTSVTAYRGSGHLMDYASTKGAIVSFTRSLASSLASKKIRVNGVAPGPIWTPLIPSSLTEKEIQEFGSEVPLKRAGQPKEVAPAFVYLASEDSSYMTGQIIHVNGGEIVNG
jgi:NAD(P)-dependent dehydrogenase (short-subunit alcohol dehydrogenase family)